MKKLNLILILLSFNALAEESLTTTAPKQCEIKTYPQIIMTQRRSLSQLQKEIIKESNCDQTTVENFVATIADLEGDIRSEQINDLMSNKTVDVFLEPTRISVIRINKIIKDKLNLQSNLELDQIQFVGTESAIGLNDIDKVKVECPNCELLGEQNLKIQITNSILGDSKNFWARSTVLKKTRIWKAREDINTLTSQNLQSQLISEEIALAKPENYLTDAQDLKFFKLNRSLRKGDLVKQSDISPIALIKSGNRVKIKVIDRNINLVSVGVANKSGNFGDSIELTNMNSKKKIVGRVVDYNTVVIDL